MSAIMPRLALGFSLDPITFDKTAILVLCPGDPGVGPGQLGPLQILTFNDHAIPEFDLRIVAASDAPRQTMRTGYGVRLAFDISMAFETVAGLSGISNALSDAAEFSLASLFAQTTTNALTNDATIPPYLYATVGYQTEWEQWIRMELDQVKQQAIAHPFGPKTYIRTLQLSISSQKTFKKVQLAYVPGRVVIEYPSAATIPVAPGGLPPYNATVTIAGKLDPSVVVGDRMLIQFTANAALDYWFLGRITSILYNPGPNTTAVGFSSQQRWPSSVAGATCRTLHVDAIWNTKMPIYGITPYSGTVPGWGFTPNIPNTLMLGNLI